MNPSPRFADRIFLLPCLALLVAWLGSSEPVSAQDARPMMTRWGRSVTEENVWQEYPRPGLIRPEWTNLNGKWKWAVTRSNGRPDAFEGEILVPFPLESSLSGVARRLEPKEVLWYRRSFSHQPKAGRRQLLHFEAVDYEAEVFINGTTVGRHVGSSDPFSFDITDAARGGENEILVRVIDQTAPNQTRGKQVLKPKGIYYTRVSGIWQTVWMESVPERRIASIKMKPRLYNQTLRVLPTLVGNPVDGEHIRITVKDRSGRKFIADGSLMAHLKDMRTWTPADPYLYDITVELLDGNEQLIDRVDSYAGMREFDIARDRDGHLRLRINGEFIFHWGTLDQGWWPDGLLTPPSDQAMRFDIEYLKSAGFNTIRKHIKREPRRYYYHCDRIGMLVWQDMPSMGGGPEWTRMAPNPPEAMLPTPQHEQFVQELKAMVLGLQNHPCIAMWVPFNERWGQHDTVRIAAMIENLDVRRPINIASGGNFFPAGDVADHHNYPAPAFPLQDKRFRDYVKVIGEFGGHGLPIRGHLWDPEMENWGYGGLPKNTAEYVERYEDTLSQLVKLKGQGIAAGIYTQTTDIEGEINGLMTYDRAVQKIPAEKLAELHRRLLGVQERERAKGHARER